VKRGNPGLQWLKTTNTILVVLISALALSPGARADILFQSSQSGAIQDWTMNGTQQTASSSLANPGSVEWKVVGSGDFTGDTLPDLLLQNSSTGQLIYWRMSGTQFQAFGYINPSYPGASGWKVVAVSDLNRDGRADIIFQNQSSGELVYWLMNGINLIQWGYLAYPGSADWAVAGAADFNRDGNQDLLFQNRQTGVLVYWQMSGTSFVAWSYLSPNNPGAQWRAAGVGDLNNDSLPDILFQNNSTGELAYWLLNGISEVGSGNIQPASAGSGWNAVLLWTTADHVPL